MEDERGRYADANAAESRGESSSSLRADVEERTENIPGEGARAGAGSDVGRVGRGNEVGGGPHGDWDWGAEVGEVGRDVAMLGRIAV